MQSNELAPIVLFVYNRPWHTRKTIESLQKNELACESELYIYADGAKNDKVNEQVLQVRDYIKIVTGFKKVTIIERNSNKGLADSIIDGVTQVVNKYGRVIVLEDDLVTSRYFLKFMNDALEFYKDEERIMHISGYIFPIDNKDLDDTFFIKPATCWGWATWRRAWTYFRKDTDYYLSVFNKEMIKDFNLDNSYDYFSQILKNRRGRINTWAIYWHASIYLNGGLSLHSKDSFVFNIGHDNEGTHCVKSDTYNVKLLQKYPINFTKFINENIKARHRVRDFFQNNRRSVFNKVINKLKRSLSYYK